MGLFDLFKKPTKSGGLGIEIGPDGMGVAYIDGLNPELALDESHKPKLECVYIEGRDINANAKSLKQFLNERSLSGVRTHVVLHPEFYEIYFVDRPQVEDNELSEAVKWKVKDLVSQPLGELLVDAFCIPDDAYRGAQKKVYAVTTHRERLISVVDTMEQAEINLETIDIGELAVRNIVNQINQSAAGTAMLRMRDASGTIDLSEGGQLYFTRQIESGITQLDAEDELSRQLVMDEMLLEIQRSLDFYNSQLGKGAIRNLMIAPTRLDDRAIDAYLAENLGLNVNSLDLNTLFEVDEVLTGEIQGHCFAAVGAAMAPQLH